MGIRLSLLVVALGVLALGCGDDSDGNSAGPGVSSGDGHDAAGGDGDGDAVGDGDGDAAPDGGSGDGDAPVGDGDGDTAGDGDASGDGDGAGDGDGDAAGDGDATGEGDGDAAGDGDAVVIDPCGDLAGAPCEEDCTFTPTDIDCLAACANMAVICDGDGGDCSAECDGQILDPDDCFDACMGARILFCGNEAFGCFEANESCAEVSTCYGETM